MGKISRNATINLGDYVCKIGTLCWGENSTTYILAVSLSNINPTSLFTKKIFCRTYSYTLGINTIKELRNWYNSTINKFSTFWKDYIKTTYLED